MGVDNMEPKIPPLVIVKVPPVKSSKLKEPSLDFKPYSEILCSIPAKSSWSASLITGTTSPRGEETAMPIS